MSDKVSYTLIGLREYEESMKTRYQLPVSTGIACPKCAEELMFDEPTIVYTSYPPCRHVKCTRCGFEKFISV